MWKCLCFVLQFAAFFTSSASFRCHICSYSSNTDVTRDCIDALDTLTAPENYYVCNRTCVIQENYSLEDKKVTSFVRTCSKVTKTGYCVRDTWSLVCFYSCIGELCNSFHGELHAVLPEQNADTDTDTLNQGTSGSENSLRRVNGLFTLLMCFGLVFGLVCGFW